MLELFRTLMLLVYCDSINWADNIVHYKIYCLYWEHFLNCECVTQGADMLMFVLILQKIMQWEREK